MLTLHFRRYLRAITAILYAPRNLRAARVIQPAGGRDVLPVSWPLCSRLGSFTTRMHRAGLSLALTLNGAGRFRREGSARCLLMGFDDAERQCH